MPLTMPSAVPRCATRASRIWLLPLLHSSAGSGIGRATAPGRAREGGHEIVDDPEPQRAAATLGAAPADGRPPSRVT